MATEPIKPIKPLLEPADRISEVLFGLIMVLAITGTLSVTSAGREDVRKMFLGALGCNLIWGIIDAVIYLIGIVSDQGRAIRSLRAVQTAKTPEEAHRAIADALPPVLADTLSSTELETARQKLVKLPEPPAHPHLGKDQWLGALAIAMWVFVVTFPVTIPFLFIDNLVQAMRWSNGIAIVLLFLTGYALGRVSEYHPWLTGLFMVVIGGALAVGTIALGG